MCKAKIKTRFLIFIVILCISVLTLSTCAPLDSNELNTTSVTLNTGINPAASRAAQTDVVSFNLRVTAAGMTTVEQSFIGASVSLEIEAGPARTFTLQALDADGNILYSGSKTVDLTAGETADIVIELGYSGFYVSFVTNGGISLPAQYVKKDELVLVISPPVRTGYTFSGWYTDATFTNVWNIAADAVDGDMTLYAKWTANTYSIIFNGNGATGGAMSDQTVDFDQTVVLTSLSYSHSSLHFIGWNTESDGSGTHYFNGESYTHTTEGDITLFAKWVPLISRWNFDGTIIDEAGGYNATGSPVYNASNPGKGLTQSIYFDGTHMLSVPAIDLGGQFSLSVWVNYSVGTTINTILANNADTGDSDGFKLYINYWSTSDRSLWINTGNGALGQSDVTSGADVMPFGSWHHIVFLVDKANGAGQIYLDNSSVASGPILSDFTSNTDLKIGGVDAFGGVFYFNGYMSDMRLYSGILDSAQISAIYNE